MIITIKNDEGVMSYDVTKIKDDGMRANANVTITKVSQLEVITEALNFASATHRGNLETLLKDTPEAVVESEEETVDEDTSTEES
jgi:hypothetical protein|tara:strand:- start:1034 stop:1288 length:255 start_codon:yes stop_codon:yes gene_type:complete